MAQNVGTAKVTIEADFSNFEKDMDSFFGKAGKDAGKSLNDGVSDGVDKAKKSLGELGDSAEDAAGDAAGAFDDVGKAAGKAGQDASKQFASGVDGVADAAAKTGKDAGKAFDGVSGAAGKAGSDSSKRFSVGVSGIQGAVSRAASGAASSFQSVVGAAGQAGQQASAAMQAGLDRMGSAAARAMSNARAQIDSGTANIASGARGMGNSLVEGFRRGEAAAGRIPPAMRMVAGALATVAGPLAILKGGFDRLMGIQKSEIIFENIGLTADETGKQMDKLSDQVTGTSVSLADAAQRSAAFAQSGVELGKPMDDAVDAFTALSAAAGDSAVDVGMVMQQISAQGKITGGDLMQLSTAGINATAWLADEMGVSMAEVRDAVSAGEVDFETFVAAVNNGAGDLAAAMGQTLPAKLSNMRTAFSNLGATILTPIIPLVTAGVEGLTEAVKTSVGWIKDFSAWLSEGGTAADVFKWAVLGVGSAITVGLLPGMASMAAGWVKGLWTSGSLITGMRDMVSLSAGFWKSSGQVVSGLAETAAGWVKAGKAAAINGAKAAGQALLDSPKYIGGVLRDLALLVKRWVTTAAVAVAQGARAGVAWLLAAPKNLAALLLNFTKLAAAWVATAATATVEAGKIALAWVLAAPKNMALGAVALGTMAAQWVRAGVAAMVNGAKIAIGWMLALGPIGLVIGAVAGVIALFVTLWNKAEGFRNFFTGMWDGIVSAVTGAWDMITEAIMGAWDTLTGWFTGGGASGLWDAVVNGAQVAWDTLKMIWEGAVDFFSGIFDVLAGIVSGAWTAISESFMWFWETVLQPIYSWIAETWGKIWDLIGPVWDQVGSKLAEFGGWFSGFWSGTIWPVLSQIIDWFKRVGETIGAFISEHWEKFKWALIILGTVLLTPIIIGMGLVVLAIAAVVTIVGVVVGALTGFVYVLMKLPGWVMGVVRAVGDWFARMWQNVKDAFSRAGSAVSDWWTNHVATLPGKVGNAIGSVINWFKELPGKIKDAVSGASRWLVDTGANIIKGLKNGLEDKVKDIGSWFLDKLPGFIRKPFEKVMGINSPSRVFAGYGVNIGEGLINGMASMKGDVQEAAQGMAGAAKDVELPELRANATVAPVPASAVAPQSAPGGAAAGEGGLPDPSLVPAAAESANVAFSTAANAMSATALGVLNPMWSQQASSMVTWGTTAATQASTVVNPALAGTGLAATSMNLTQWQPAMLAMRNGVTTTATTTQAQANGVMNPAVRSVGATALGVLNGSVNPAMSGMRSAVAHTADSFRTGARNIGVYWNQVREATAQPARFTINRVFNDGIVGMWNSATELLGTKKMNRYHASFSRGGTWRGGSTLPGYTPGRDTYRFVEPRSGMSIDMGGGESIMRPEVTKALGTSRVDSLNAAARMGGTRAVTRTLGQFASGGVVPSITNLVKRYYPMMTITSTHRNTADNHGRGLAVDFSNGSDSTPQMRSAAQFFYQNYGKGLLELIHSPFNNNVKNGKNMGDGFGFYGAGTMNQHRNHVHVAAAAPLGAPGSGVIPVVGDGGSVDPAAYIKEMAKPYMDKMKAALANRQKQGGLVDQWPEAVAGKMQAAAHSKMVKAFEEMGADPGGAGVERWRPLAKKAMARTGFDWRNPAQVNAMMKQIASESGGNPGIRQQVIDVNSGGNEAMGLLQIIPGTFAAHRDPALPNDRTHPFANMVAALRYYRSRYGGDLTTMWGQGHGYDNGGLITEKGLFSKQTTEAERVLSPRTTRSFEELVDFLSGSGWDDFVSATGAGTSGSPFAAGGPGREVRVAQVANHFHGPVGTTTAADTINDRIAAKAW